MPPAVLPVLAELVRCSAPGSYLDVLTPSGARQSIIGCHDGVVGIGYGRGTWNVLTPSGTP